MRTAFVIMTVLCVFLLSCSGLRYDGAFAPSQRDWVMYGGAPERTNATPSDPAPPFEERWTYDARGGVLATPLVRDSIVIIATLYGELHMVSLSDGKRIGVVKLGGPIHGTPVIAGYEIIVPLLAGDATLVSFGLRRGKISWGTDAGPIASSPLLLNERIYVANLNGEILCVDRLTGEVRWRFAPGSAKERKSFRSSPALAEDLIVCGNDDGTLYAVRATDGAPVWSSSTSSPVFATPVVEDGAVVFANLDGLVRSVDAVTGEQRWERKLNGPVYASPSSDGPVVYVATGAGVCAAIEHTSGVVRWSWSAESVINASVLVSSRHIYTGSLDKHFTVLDKTTGRIEWNTTLDGRMKVPAVTWNDYLIIVYEDKTVAALRGVKP